MINLGDFNAGAVVRMQFPTSGDVGESVAPSGAVAAADFKIFKNGVAVPRASTAGVTVLISFGGVVGVNYVAIATANDTDPGFFAAGNDYSVVFNPDTETIDGVAVNSPIGMFSIENRPLSQTQLDAIADAVLLRDWEEMDLDSVPERCLLQAARFIRNAWALIDGTLYVAKEDDDVDNPAWSKPVESTPGADPVTATGGG